MSESTELDGICEYEQTIMDVTRATLEDEVEPHDDFDDLTADQQERVREWALTLVAAGFQTAMGLKEMRTNHRSALMAETAVFLDELAALTNHDEVNAEALRQ